MSAQKEFEAFWRGFNLAKQIVDKRMLLGEFDFSKCKNNKNVCAVVRRELLEELKHYQSGDHKYGAIDE
jgi:hypothetical protein